MNWDWERFKAQSGHPEFAHILDKQLALHNEKNADYAGGGSPLGNFERSARIMKNYPNFPYNQPQGVAFLYALKHLDRILWDMSRGLTPSAESLNDLAVYMNIIQTMGASDA